MLGGLALPRGQPAHWHQGYPFPGDSLCWHEKFLVSLLSTFSHVDPRVCVCWFSHVIHVYRSEYLKEIYVCQRGSCAINCDHNNQRQDCVWSGRTGRADIIHLLMKFNLLVNLVLVSVITGERGQLHIEPERSTLGNILSASRDSKCVTAWPCIANVLHWDSDAARVTALSPSRKCRQRSAEPRQTGYTRAREVQQMQGPLEGFRPSSPSTAFRHPS